MRISIIGSGHVGLVTGVCFAERGHTVLCVDHDPAKIKALKAGKAPFYEPGLQELLDKHRSGKLLQFSASTPEAVEFGEVIFICVSTPNIPGGGVDMRYFESVSRDIARALTGKYRVIVEKSTVPVKTSERVRECIERYAKKGAKFDVASNPEFLREGMAVHDALNPDRIVIGTASKQAEQLLRKVYAGFESKLLTTSIQSAELIKLASNAYLAMRVSFVNAVSRICELGGADIDEVTKGMGLDPRIGPHFLKAGLGYGGSCFSKDVEGMYHMAGELGYSMNLLKEVQRINEDQWLHMVSRVEKELWVLSGKTVALWGLSFKPGTDDIREAPAVKVARELTKRGAIVRAYDPHAMENVKKILPDLTFAKNALDAAKGADALVLCTEWQEFLEQDMAKVKAVMNVPLVFDGRNVLKAGALKRLGFTYHAVGKS